MGLALGQAPSLLPPEGPLCALTWGIRASRLLGLAGSAGIRCSTSRVSTAITPTGMPPNRARPTTTDLPHPAKYSWKLPLSKKPLTQLPFTMVPASMCRGS